MILGMLGGWRLAAGGAVFAAIVGGIAWLRWDAADDVKTDIQIKELEEIRDAQERARPAPRPGDDAWLECLRAGRGDCLRSHRNTGAPQ